jgi:hypothetical protein
MGDKSVKRGREQDPLVATNRNRKRNREPHLETDPWKNLWEPSTELVKETRVWQAFDFVVSCNHLVHCFLSNIHENKFMSISLE